MRTHLWSIVFALLCLATGPAPAQPFQPEVAAGLVNEDRYPARPSFPRGVTGLPDLVYGGQAGRRPLLLDLYLPPGPAATPRALIVYIHGGLWTGGSRRTSGAFANWPLALAALAARGFVVASIDYRRAAEATFPEQIYNVKQALRWLRSKAGTYGIDRSRVLVWGADAGGQLAALAAVSCGAAGLERGESGAPPNPVIGANVPPPPVAESACAQAAVVWYGVADLTRIGDMPQANEFLGCTAPTCAPQRKLASPVTYIVDNTVPPFLVIHGMEDLVVPVSQAARLNAAIREKNGSVELILLPGVGYGFVGPTPAETRDASLRAWQRTVDFIERMMRSR
jgi:acetyl esterase/lipase